MIIEFLGVSGVGKTTIGKQLRRKLEEEGWEVVWDTYNLYAHHGWLSRNIRKGYAVVKYAITHKKWVQGYKVFLSKSIKKRSDIRSPLFNGIYLKTRLEKARTDNKIHIFDEGALQYLWAVKLRGVAAVSGSDIRDIERYLGLPDELIVVEASVETIASRIEKRGEYVRIMKDGNLKKMIIKMKGTQQKIVHELGCRVKVIYIDNDSEQK